MSFQLVAPVHHHRWVWNWSHIGPELPGYSTSPGMWLKQCQVESSLGTATQMLQGWASEADIIPPSHLIEKSCLQNKAVQRQADVREEWRDPGNIHLSSSSWSPGLCVSLVLLGVSYSSEHSEQINSYLLNLAEFLLITCYPKESLLIPMKNT